MFIPKNSTLFHFPSKPAQFAVRKHKYSADIEHLSLEDLLRQRCSSLFSDYRPLWYLFNGHFQTLYSIMADFSRRDRLWYRRQFIRLVDGGTLALDFTPTDSSQLPDDTPIVVVQHGLTGGSHEHYIREILVQACSPVAHGGLGYRAVVVTFRGCAGTPITSPRLYTAGHTDDLRQALMYITAKYPRAPLLGLGFSLGANIMTRYVAEEGERSRLSSALVLSCPWDIENNGHRIVSTFLGKNIWSRGMGTNMLKLVKRHEGAFRADPDHPLTKTLPSALALRYPTLDEFDSAFTKNVGDTRTPFPFSTVMEYYRWASSDKVVKSIRVPFLSINAEDDPVVVSAPMDGAGNPNVVMALTRHGGHLAWFQTGIHGGIERWTTKPAIEWLRLMGDDIVQTESKAHKVYLDGMGYIREEGLLDLGCKELDGGGVFEGNAKEQGLLLGL